MPTNRNKLDEFKSPAAAQQHTVMNSNNGADSAPQASGVTEDALFVSTDADQKSENFEVAKILEDVKNVHEATETSSPTDVSAKGNAKESANDNPEERQAKIKEILNELKENGYDFKATNGDTLSFHHWDDVRSDNIGDVLIENLFLKPYRIGLFKTQIEFLDSIDVPYFITDGTALAAFRDGGVMIPHDYDTDVAIMEKYLPTVYKNLHLLPSHVTVRTKCDYTGIEWVNADGTAVPFQNEGAKKFIFQDNRDLSHLKIVKELDFYAECDLYTWRALEDDPEILAMNYAATGKWKDKRFPKDVIFPLKRYNFEGIQVLGPNDIEAYLKLNYGYLGKDSMWDPATQSYVKRP